MGRTSPGQTLHSPANQTGCVLRGGPPLPAAPPRSLQRDTPAGQSSTGCHWMQRNVKKTHTYRYTHTSYTTRPTQTNIVSSTLIKQAQTRKTSSESDTKTQRSLRQTQGGSYCCYEGFCCCCCCLLLDFTTPKMHACVWLVGYCSQNTLQPLKQQPRPGPPPQPAPPKYHHPPQTVRVEQTEKRKGTGGRRRRTKEEQ